MIASSSSSLSNTWIVRPRPKPDARLRLFCFPYAGAGPAVYRSWADELPAEVEVCSILLPGREARLREKPYVSMQPLVEGLLQGLGGLLEGGYAFYGHSLGALIAFELARALRRQGRPLPVHLFLSSRRAPHLPDERAPLHNLPDALFVAAVQRRYQGIPPVILQDAELLALFLPTLKADFAVLETYRYETDSSVFEMPFSLYGGATDPTTPPEALEAWRGYTSGKFSVETYPGDHFFLQNNERSSSRALLLQAIARELRLRLLQSGGSPADGAKAAFAGGGV